MASPSRVITFLLISFINTLKFSCNLRPILALLTFVLITMIGPYLKIEIRSKGACFGLKQAMMEVQSVRGISSIHNDFCTMNEG